MVPSAKIETSSQRHLLPSILWPLCLGLLLVAVSIALWLGKRSEDRLADLLFTRAEAIAHSLQESAALMGSDADLNRHLFRLQNNIIGLENISVFGADGALLASSNAAHEKVRTLPESDAGINGLIEKQGSRFLYSIPLRFDFEVEDPVHRNSVSDQPYQVVVALDSSQAIANVRSNVLSLLAAGLAGLALVCAYCYFLVRHYVVVPIRSIQRAVSDTSAEPVQMPVFRCDEIGALAVVLEQALDKIRTQEDQLTSIISNVTGCVYRFDSRTGLAVLVSPQVEELTGCSAGHFRSIDNLMEFLGEDRDRVFQEVSQACIEGRSWNIDHTLIRHDGEQRWANTTGKATYDRDGRVMFIDGLVVDTTDRIRQQNALLDSEQRYQRAIQNSNDGIWEWQRATDQFYVSEGFKHLLGIPAEEHIVIDRFIAKRLHPDDRQWMLEHVKDCLVRGIDLEAEFRLQTENGRYVWVLAKGKCSRDEQGKAMGLAGSVTHISKRKHAETLLKHTATRLGAVLDHVADGILLLNQHGRIKSTNPALQRLLNCSERDLEDLAFSHFLSLDNIVQIDWRALCHQGELTGYVTRSTGGQIPVEAIARSMHYDDEEMYTLVVRDISERRKAERALVEARDKAEAATRAKSEFLATMSHEIRTPMNGVLGMTQLLMDMGLTEDQKETARVIYASGEALLTIINDILDFSKIEAGKLEIEAIPFDLRRSVGEVLELLSGRVEEKGLEIFVDYPIDTSHRLRGDPGRIRQILMNLIGNAIKFTEEGHVLVTVEELALKGSRASIKFSIQDTGIGIDETTQQKLFESFTQADTSTTRRFGGTGLGLSISHQLVELMGGEIGVNSEPGKGSTFWFTLQLPRDESPVTRDTSIPDLSHRKALVVDDNHIGRQILLRTLTRLGMDVSTATSAENCLELLHTTRYDIALLDYQMPRVDGEMLVECIRANAEWDGMKLLMLTSSGLIGERQRLLDLGVDKYLLKPVLQKPLFSALRELLIHQTRLPPHHSRSAEELDADDADQSMQTLGDGIRCRVLLAEDNIVNQKVAVRMLEQLGCVVDVAENGQEALSMWQKSSYSLVFMDCQMPELDGIEATRRIRQRESANDLPRTPIIAMTANAMDGDEGNCIAAGMDDYVAKPVRTEVLAAMFSKWRQNARNSHPLH